MADAPIGMLAEAIQPRPGRQGWHGGPTPVSAVAPGLLSRRPPTSRRWTYGELILGIAMHDAYHTGQIQLVKRLWQER